MGAYECVAAGADTDPPVLFDLTPTGSIDYTETTQLSVKTSETATCRYHASSTTWADMTAMSSTGGTTHTQTVSVAVGANSFKVVCQDSVPNESAASTWSFTVADPAVPEYVVTISYTGTGSGVTDPVAGTYNVDTGVTYTVTQTADALSTFAGWSGTCGCTGSDACAPTITANCTIIATFNSDTQYLLTVTYPTDGSVVTSDTGAIICGGNDRQCSDTYYSGTVTLTGACGTGYYGGAWAGNGTGTTTREFTMDADQSVSFSCSKTGGQPKVGTGAGMTIGTGVGMIIP
jgi:hypothetical protein